MTDIKRRMCELDAASIAYYRRNPCIASEDLLGIRLTDVQKWILQSSWNASHSVWCCSRDFGKSFLGAVFMILKAGLYENQGIYIISSVGDQAKETHGKIEEIVLRIGKTSASIESLKDIFEHETVKTPTNKTGFSHNTAGYKVAFYNGSEIMTLNSAPDSARSRRATLVFFDEAAFCSDDLIVVCEAFAAQNSDFRTSTDPNYNPAAVSRRVPTQLIYASSQDSMDKLFYKHYKEFSKQMIAGNRDYFVCDMICDTAIKTYMSGKPYTALLTQSKVETAIKANREKAMREYYNQPTMDGGISQIVKWGTIRRNERPYLPILEYKPNIKIVMAFDPARLIDNSILSVMVVYQDPLLGWCGDIVNCVSFIDVANKKKYKLDSNRQLEEIRNALVTYNGTNPDYEMLDMFLIDEGAGGGGLSTYADALLNNWRDRTGHEHRGLIDAGNEKYAGYAELYPDAIDKLRLLSPRKMRTQMVEEFIDLMELGVLHFPLEYTGHETLRIVKDVDSSSSEEVFENYKLAPDEILALSNIDLMKYEIATIRRSSNADKTSVTYALAKDKENKMHDDRFYTSIMLAHRLFELRRGQIIASGEQTFDYANAPRCVDILHL